MAHPELTIKVDALPEVAWRTAMETSTGDALKAFLVNVPAAAHGLDGVENDEWNRPMSSAAAFFLMPECRDAHEYPLGNDDAG